MKPIWLKSTEGDIRLVALSNRDEEYSPARRIQERVGDPTAKHRQKDLRRDGLSAGLGRPLLPGNSFGDSRRNRQFEELVLVRLNHEKYPEHEAHQADQHGNKRPQTETQQSAKVDDHSHADSQNGQRTEDYNRLRRVESDERPLVDQKEDDPGDPADSVAEQSGHVLREALTGRCCRYCRSTLARTAFWTERRAGEVCAARFAERHCRPPTDL